MWVPAVQSNIFFPGIVFCAMPGAEATSAPVAMPTCLQSVIPVIAAAFLSICHFRAATPALN